MEQVLALRPFVPAKDFALSKRFYLAIGFRLSHEDAELAMFKRGFFGFILVDLPHFAAPGGPKLQLLVRDVDAFWAELDTDALVRDFAVPPPEPPILRPWGMKVGFLWDPTGVQWHVAEVPF